MGCFEVKKVEIHRPKSRGFNQFVLFFPNCRSHCSLLTFTSVGPDFTGATVTSCGMGAGGLTDCSLVEKGLRKSVEVVVIVGKCCENKNIESLCTAKFESLNSVFWHHDLPMFYPWSQKKEGELPVTSYWALVRTPLWSGPPQVRLQIPGTPDCLAAQVKMHLHCPHLLVPLEFWGTASDHLPNEHKWHNSYTCNFTPI